MGAPLILAWFATLAGSLALCAILAASAFILYYLIAQKKEDDNTGILRLSWIPFLDALALFFMVGFGTSAWTVANHFLIPIIAPAFGIEIAALSAFAWPITVSLGLMVLFVSLLVAWVCAKDPRTKRTLAIALAFNFLAIIIVVGLAIYFLGPATVAAMAVTILTFVAILLIVGLCKALGATFGNYIGGVLGRIIQKIFGSKSSDRSNPLLCGGLDTNQRTLFIAIAFLGAIGLLLPFVVCPLIAIPVMAALIFFTFLACYVYIRRNAPTDETLYDLDDNDLGMSESGVSDTGTRVMRTLDFSDAIVFQIKIFTC